jgi:flagellar protein FlaJ
MKLKKIHWIGIGFGLSLIAAGFLFFLNSEEQNLFYFMLGLGLIISFLPFLVNLIGAGKKEHEINEMFLEFTRNLAESVSTGTPISKSIVNMSRKSYGALSPNVVKLGNQIALGIPLAGALNNFAKDVNNPVISRAVALISEAERAGGNIDKILDSVAISISEIEKLKLERKASISQMVVQGYLIFFIFIGIMLIMEFKILPLALEIDSLQGIGSGEFGVEAGGNKLSQESLGNLFLYLLLAQGFFTGFAIGKLSEGSLNAGVKHSFILVVSAFMIAFGVRILF